MDELEALEIVLDYTDEWTFVDEGVEDNICPECQWSKRQAVRENPGVTVFLTHHPGCKFKEALEILRKKLDDS